MGWAMMLKHDGRLRRLLALLAFMLLLPLPASARPPSLVPADAPELAAPGPSPVGVREMRFDAGPGRKLGLTIFYPAATAGKATRYAHKIVAVPDGLPDTMVFEAIATENAAPAAGPRLPLVILSHGFNRWSTAMSGMAENLASKGYIVASIDHNDDGAMDPGQFLTIFGTAFQHRSADQRAAIAFLQTFAKSNEALARRVDAGNVAVIGYSMGGFGALATGGAGYSKSGPIAARLPAGSMAAALEGGSAEPAVKALVLIAPWGGNADVRAWTPAGLAGVTLPSLWIMGDKDDVAGTDGIQWLHDTAINSDRRLLIFANARHNLGGNPPPASAPDTPRLRDMLDEPVWRKDMADAIIFRQLTAFLNLTLKRDAASTQWLDADAAGILKGFQKRWQLGFKMLHAPAGRGR